MHPPSDLIDEDPVGHLAVSLQGVSLDQSLPIATTSIKTLKQEFKQIANANGWKPSESKYRAEYASFLGHEFSSLVGGTKVKLQVLQQLCIDFGCGPDAPPSITQCKKVGMVVDPKSSQSHQQQLLSGKFVNIYDYITCKRDGRPVKPVFKDGSRFREYTLNGKIFPKAAAKRNKILRALLERIF